MKFISLTFLALVLFLSSCSSTLSTAEYLERASNYMDKKEWKSAVIEYKNGIKQSPKNAKIRYLLGKAYLQTYSSDAAIKEFTKAVELGFDSNELLVFLGEAYAQGNKNELIINDIKVNDILDNAQKVKVMSLRADAFMRLNLQDNALVELDKAKLIDSSNQSVRLSWARYESVKGNNEQELEWLNPLLDLNIADAWSQKGNLDRKNQDFKEAEISFTKAIELRQSVHLDYLFRALVRISLKTYEEAKSDLALLQKAGFVTPVILHSEGVIAFYQGDLDLAQSKFDEVLAKYKEYPPSLFVLGLTHFQKANFESAINVLSQYLKVLPNNTQARLVMATSLLKLNKIKESIVELEVLYKADQNNEKVTSLLGSAYVMNGQLADGVRLFEQSAKQNPKQAIAQYQLGSALIRDKKNVKKGQQALIKALNLDPELIQANLSLYLSYMQSKDFIDAAKIATQMMDKKPNDSLAYNLLGQAYLAEGDIDKATKSFQSTLEKFPSDPVTSENIARIKIRENKMDDAKNIYLNVLNKYPDNLRVLLNLAVIESRQGNDDKKMEYLKRAVDSNLTDLSPKLILATEYLKQNNFKGALNALRDINDADKLKIQVKLINAKAKMGLKEYDFAQVLLKKLVAEYPNSTSSRFLLGLNYGYLNNKESMKTAFEQVLKVKPNHFSASLILTRLALLEGKKSEFERKVKQMLKAYPDNADVKFLNAKLESSDKNYQTAISTLEGLFKDTSNPEVMMDLARNKWTSGDKIGAITNLELWLDSNPEDKAALMLLGQFYIAQNRVADANDIYTRVDKLLPDNAIVLNNLAWLYRETDVEQGIKLARRALKLEPNSPFIKDTLAMLLLGNDQAKEALIYSEQAAKAQPNFIEIQINYAEVLVANQDNDNAKKILNAIDTSKSTFDQRAQVRTLLSNL